MAISTTRAAMRLCIDRIPEGAAIICANGYVSREAYNAGDRDLAFYMLGSMGLAPAIAFGVAHARPDVPVWILDGDGNVLMSMGNLALIGAFALPNIHHVCFDNGVYASTGNQTTIAGKVAIERVAEAAGYRHTARIGDEQGLIAALDALADTPGPHFLRVMLDAEPHPREDIPRIAETPEQLRDRLAGALTRRSPETSLP